jgi:hypothetical protein
MSQNQDSIKTILEAHAAINRIVNDVKGKYPADVAIVQGQNNNTFSNGTEGKTTATAATAATATTAATAATALSDDQIRQKVAKVFNYINSATTLEGLKNAVEEFNTTQSKIPRKFITDPNVASNKAAEITVSAIKKATTVAEVDSAVAEFNKYRYQGSKDQVQLEADAKKVSLLRAQSIPSTDTQVDDEIKAAIGSINQAALLDEIKTIVATFNSKKFRLVAGKQFTVPSAASKRAADITIAAINAASDEAGVNAAVATFMSDSNTFKSGQGRVVAAAKRAALADIEKEIESIKIIADTFDIKTTDKEKEPTIKQLEQLTTKIETISDETRKQSLKQEIVNLNKQIKEAGFASIGGGSRRKTRRVSKSKRSTRRRSTS